MPQITPTYGQTDKTELIPEHSTTYSTIAPVNDQIPPTTMPTDKAGLGQPHPLLPLHPAQIDPQTTGTQHSPPIPMPSVKTTTCGDIALNSANKANHTATSTNFTDIPLKSVV